MKNKQAKQSALSVYGKVFMESELCSDRYYWSFDRLRNCELGFKRPKSHMRFKNFDVVSIKGDI